LDAIECAINLIDHLLHLCWCIWPPIDEEELAVSPCTARTRGKFGDEALHLYLPDQHIRNHEKKEVIGWERKLLAYNTAFLLA
jgi:hypothetical protein